MLVKKFKFLVGLLVSVTPIFIFLPGEANDLSINGVNNCRNMILAEALVEYPFGWFYTLDEMDELYKIEYYNHPRLDNFIRCENEKCFSECNNKLLEIPGQFIDVTLKLIKQMLDGGFAKYLFRLDTFHGHFFVSEEKFKKTYADLKSNIMKEFINDDSLGVLFHCSEHLALRNPPRIGDIDKKAQKLIHQRNIIGWYNTESIEIFSAGKSELVGSGKSNTATIPQGYRRVGIITFKANVHGEFSIKQNGKIIKLDMSLCDYYYY